MFVSTSGQWISMQALHSRMHSTDSAPHAALLLQPCCHSCDNSCARPLACSFSLALPSAPSYDWRTTPDTTCVRREGQGAE